MTKIKVLIVDANQDSRAALARALTDAGYEVATATSGSFAVTMLEWERPDLIVSYAKIQDMDGYELFTMVRRDPATKDTPFLLLAGRDRPIALAATEAGVDMTEVTQAISLGGKTGRLILSLQAGEGSIVFEAGRVVHAEFSGRTGEKAFAAMVSTSQREEEARFCFNRAERADLAAGPKTISRSVEQLLLSIAADIDESASGPVGHRLPAASHPKDK